MLLWAQLRPVLQRGDKKLSVKQTERKQHRVFLEGNPEKPSQKGGSGQRGQRGKAHDHHCDRRCRIHRKQLHLLRAQETPGGQNRLPGCPDLCGESFYPCSCDGQRELPLCEARHPRQRGRKQALRGGEAGHHRKLRSRVPRGPLHREPDNLPGDQHHRYLCPDGCLQKVRHQEIPSGLHG